MVAVMWTCRREEVAEEEESLILSLSLSLNFSLILSCTNLSIFSYITLHLIPTLLFNYAIKR